MLPVIRHLIYNNIQHLCCLTRYSFNYNSRGGENRTPLTTPVLRLFPCFTPFSYDYFDYFVIILLKTDCFCNLFHFGFIIFIAVIIIFTCCFNICVTHHFTNDRIINIIITQCSSVGTADFVCRPIINF